VLGSRRHLDALRRVSLFERLSGRELAGIAAIAAEEQFPAGHELTREGDPGRSFYIILEGRADVYQGEEKLAERGGGEFFGEIALIAHSPRTATVKAVTPVRALVIADRKFRGLLGRQPQLQLKVIEALRDRVGH
jgi:CRP-like cAMP-binding protein